MLYKMILAYFFAWYPRNERHHNQKSKRHWWDCLANIPNVLGTHYLHCCRSHSSILAGASQIALKWGENNLLLSKVIPISWWEHHKKNYLVQVMLYFQNNKIIYYISHMLRTWAINWWGKVSPQLKVQTSNLISKRYLLVLIVIGTLGTSSEICCLQPHSTSPS